MPHSTLNSLRGVEGQQLQQYKVQAPQRHVANTLVPSLAVILASADL